MKNSIFILIFIFIFVNCNRQKENNENSTSFDCNCTFNVEPFDDTIILLKGGYQIRYYFDYFEKDSLCVQVVDLMKKDKRINQINSIEYRFNKGGLGWVQADYENKFLFIIGIQSQPNVFEIVLKKSGKTLLKGFFHDEKNDVVMYSTFEDYLGNQQLRIIDVMNNKDFELKEFKGLESKWEDEWFADNIRLDSVSALSIWVSLESVKGKVTKMYNRLK